MEKTPTESAPVVIQSVQSDGVFNAGIILIETNYDVWSQIMEMHLAEREKLSYICSYTKPSEESSKEYEKWYSENQKVKRWLLISMSPEIMKRYLRIPTAYEIWDALSKAFYDGSDELQVFTLNQKAFSIKQNGQPLSKFYGELIEIFRELDHRDKVVMKDPEDVVIYRRSVERLRVHIFLAGLDEEFDQVRGEILRKDIIPDLEEFNLDWPVQQFDVKNAFLYGNLSEEIYMDLPLGCSGLERLNQKGCKLKKSLHGLKQSPRAWFGKFTKAMVLFGYNQSSSDHTLFIKKRQDQVPVDKGRYQRLIGRLMYLSHTRPDLAYALSVVSQFMHNPGEQHIKAVMRILRYLKTNPGKRILFSKNEDYSNIEVYTDADWVGSVSDRRSTSGHFTFVGGNLVTWRSKKQHVVARSSAETEYRGMALGVCEGLWISFILNDLGYPSQQPIQLYCDNKAARDIAHNPVQHDRTKHVEIDRFFIKEKLDEKILELLKIRSEDQLVDILTKAISSRAFTKFLDKLGMQDIYAPA
ncbi:hypothetical protein KPL71_021292 [Citrus sinensis]|uniref:Uncharacterized protein n=1 Tax=Citrus sinensis TaxID=2711 RepID=A0ACB8JE45_CITSI|nr:hypothetical protein KPL71_021292 [Citrus sinensis]